MKKGPKTNHCRHIGMLKHDFTLMREAVKLWIKKKLKYKNCAFFLPSKREEKAPEPAKIVSVQGFLYTGSGALLGLLGECDNVYVMGAPEYNFTKGKLKKATVSECFFFQSSNFFGMVNSYGKGMPEERDMLIKCFIMTCRNYVQNSASQPLGFESAPDFFNDQFANAVHDFLMNVLEMNETTHEYMRGKEHFPTTVDTEFAHLSCDWEWDKLSFAHYWGGNRYFLRYDFKKMPQKELQHYVSNFLRAFFSILPPSPVHVYDQLMPGNIMEQINAYLLDRPVKQLCVWRDPRDRYMDILNYDTWGWADASRSPSTFCKRYLRKLMSMKTDPNRLFIRFEDLVLKYDETRDKIFKFIGMEPTHQHEPRSVFDPSISVKNVGRWRLYPDQRLMQRIEEKMGRQFCFYPEKENLSPQAWELLESSGNWNNYHV